MIISTKSFEERSANLTGRRFALAHRPSYQAYQLLHAGFIVLPVVVGVDKFFNILVNWSVYLSPVVSDMINAQSFMKIIGVIEVAAGLIVAFKPKFGAYVVAFWLWAVILNLLTMPGFYDIAIRDFGLSLGALALGFLAKEYSRA